MSAPTELAALERNLHDAIAAHEESEKAVSAARRAECDARNNLNAAQRQLDAYVKKLRDAAPSASDWGSERTKKLRVPA